MDTERDVKTTIDPDLQFEALLSKIKETAHGMDLGRIRAAYEMARVAHSGQLRRDGSPYVTHCIAAADISVDIGLDEDSIIKIVQNTYAYIDEYIDPSTERGKCLVKTICDAMGFDSLNYQSLDGMLEAIGIDRNKICTYCWNGKE